MSPHKAQQLIELPHHVREIVSERLNDAQNEAYAEGRKDERAEWLPMLEAAQAVVYRWDSPKWKEQAPTADYIARLRAAISKATGEAT